MITRQVKPKTCRECRGKFVPVRPMQPVCDSFECKLAYASRAASKSAENRKKAERKADKEKLDALKPLRKYADEAQTAFNAWKREVDLRAGHGCISCGTHKAVQWHAGHYRTVKAAKQLRYNPDNVHLQCSQCNSWDSGNVVEYRINLVKRIGLARVETLETNNEIKRYSKEELIEIKNRYTKLLRELKGGMDGRF